MLEINYVLGVIFDHVRHVSFVELLAAQF
jgi:hypothetical protein